MTLSLPARFSFQEAMLSRHALPEKSVPTVRSLGMANPGRLRHREAQDQPSHSA